MLSRLPLRRGRRANLAIDKFLADAENADAVTEFKKLNERVASECGEEKYCTLDAGGKSAVCKGCYWRDAGCGQECMHKVLSEKNLARRDRVGANESNVVNVSSNATTARRRRR